MWAAQVIHTNSTCITNSDVCVVPYLVADSKQMAYALHADICHAFGINEVLAVFDFGEKSHGIGI
jgi:hypothetical protein